MNVPSPFVLIPLCKNVMDKLINSPVNSIHGISIVACQSMGNPIMLNVTKPAVLQQYYGVDIEDKDQHVVLKATFGFLKGLNKAGIGPHRYTLKSFDNNLHAISTCVMKILQINVVE